MAFISAALARDTTLTRLAVVRRLVAALGDHEWAFQGADDAVARWVADDSMADLDLWVSDASAAAVADAVAAMGGVTLCRTTDRARLRHHQFWVPAVNSTGTRTGAIIDATVGDLRVGPVLLLSQVDITVAPRPVRLADAQFVGAPTLAGAARVADLALRPLLRGRIVDGTRWRDASLTTAMLRERELGVLRGAILRAVGRHHADTVHLWLGRGRLTPDMVPVRDAARRRLVLASLAPGAALATWRQRRIILPARSTGPAGMRSRGVLVALVGTDGSGKSTTAGRLGSALETAGFEVRHEYFGMARGNLPGIGLMRRLAGGGNTEARPESTAPTTPGLAHRLASWVYVLDYGWRYLRRVRPALRRGEAVICDRWVSDLRRHPVPDSPASRLAEWLVGAPDVIVLNDAPPEEIVARKQERTLEAATAEQAALRRVGEALEGRRVRRGGRCRFLVVNTSSVDERTPAVRIQPVVQALMAAAHDRLPR